MEARFLPLLKKWPSHAALVPGQRPVLVLSRQGLNGAQTEELCNDFVQASGPNSVSVILSLKMMHVYFRIGTNTLDYRPHRGPFSGLTMSPYRPAKSDRSEVILEFNSDELERFQRYVGLIQEAPTKVLGKPYPLQLREPDFTVRQYVTQGDLGDNRLLDPEAKHNCMTWFATAPIGPGGAPVWDLLGMSQSDLETEAHSYIVRFYEFLAKSASARKVSAICFWTGDSIDRIRARIIEDQNFVQEFYTA